MTEITRDSRDVKPDAAIQFVRKLRAYFLSALGHAMFISPLLPATGDSSLCPGRKARLARQRESEFNSGGKNGNE